MMAIQESELRQALRAVAPTPSPMPWDAIQARTRARQRHHRVGVTFAITILLIGSVIATVALWDGQDSALVRPPFAATAPHLLGEIVISGDTPTVKQAARDIQGRAVHELAAKSYPDAGEVVATADPKTHRVTVAARGDLTDAAAARTVNSHTDAYLRYLAEIQAKRDYVAAVGLQSKIDALQRQIDALASAAQTSPTIAETRATLLLQRHTLQDRLLALRLDTTLAAGKVNISHEATTRSGR